MNYRDEVVAVKVTKEEKYFLKKMSFECEKSMGTIVRDAIKHKYEDFPLSD